MMWGGGEDILSRDERVCLEMLSRPDGNYCNLEQKGRERGDREASKKNEKGWRESAEAKEEEEEEIYLGSKLHTAPET